MSIKSDKKTGQNSGCSKVISKPETIQQSSRIINCNKCGAALRIKSDLKAYICPVCKTLFRVQISKKAVREISEKN